MSRRVVIFSADIIRGNIAARKLSREGFNPCLLDRAVAAAAAVAAEQPRAFVFDTVHCIPDELRFLLRCCCESLLKGKTNVVVLGNPNSELPWTANLAGAKFLSDPLDPEALTTAVAACFVIPVLSDVKLDLSLSTPENLQSSLPIVTSESDLETQLMDFLRLR